LFNSTSCSLFSSLSLHDALPILLRLVFSYPDGNPVLHFLPSRLNHSLIRYHPHPGTITWLMLITFPGLPTGCQRLPAVHGFDSRSEEHTSELQSRFDLVCRLLLE